MGSLIARQATIILTFVSFAVIGSLHVGLGDLRFRATGLAEHTSKLFLIFFAVGLIVQIASPRLFLKEQQKSYGTILGLIFTSAAGYAFGAAICSYFLAALPGQDKQGYLALTAAACGVFVGVVLARIGEVLIDKFRKGPS